MPTRRTAAPRRTDRLRRIRPRRVSNEWEEALPRLYAANEENDYASFEESPRSPIYSSGSDEGEQEASSPILYEGWQFQRVWIPTVEGGFWHEENPLGPIARNQGRDRQWSEFRRTSMGQALWSHDPAPPKHPTVCHAQAA